MSDKQRGALLVEELPSVLQGYGSEFLHIVIQLDEKTVESNLKEELLLGEAMFDPFALMQAMDKCPATTAFWSVLLTECKESLAEAERRLKVATGNIKMTISEWILTERPASSNKMPSAAEIDDRYSAYFLTEGSERITATFPPRVTIELVGELSTATSKQTERGINFLTLKAEFDAANKTVEELQSKVRKIEIVYLAWKDKGYMLTAQANLMQTLINQELIKIPKSRSVYKGWD